MADFNEIVRATEAAQQSQAAIAALEKRVAELEEKERRRERQQITNPLDLASQRVLKTAMRRAGFIFP